jgi:hypothetical protein
VAATFFSILQSFLERYDWKYLRPQLFVEGHVSTPEESVSTAQNLRHPSHLHPDSSCVNHFTASVFFKRGDIGLKLTSARTRAARPDMSFDLFGQNTPSNTLQKGGGLETDHRSGRCERKFPYDTILAS